MAVEIPLEQRYVNEAVRKDRRLVLTAGILLLIVGLLQGGVALAVSLAGDGGLGRGLTLDDRNFVMLWALEGGAALFFALLTLRNSFFALVFATCVRGLGLIHAVISRDVVLAAIELGIVLMLLRGVGGLMRVNDRIASSQQDNPLTAYYHYFVPLLVRVMAADGRVDRREQKKIAEICDSMNISTYEQRWLIRAAIRARTDVAEVVRGYLRQAGVIGLRNPGQKIVMAALAVAGADGHLATQEEQVIRELGSALKVPSDELEAMLAQHQASLGEVTPSIARRVLQVPEGATREQVDSAYATYRRDLDGRGYTYLGRELARHVDERRQVLDRAYEALGGQPATPR